MKSPMSRLPLLLSPFSRVAHQTLLLMLLAMAGAVSAQTLSEVTLPVADRSTEARGATLRAGLEQILVRLTGSRTPDTLPGAAAMLDAPESWVAQYGYVGSGDALQLQARFDVQAISDQLARNGAPVWGAARPPLLVWAVSDRGDIHGRDSEANFVRALRSRAEARGLPLLLPAMDDTDRAQISASDIRGRFDRQLAEASRRYDSPLTATVVYYTGGRPSLRWRIVQEGSTLREGQLSADSEAGLAGDLADTLADYIADLYAVQGSEARLARLEIEGLDSLSDWQAVRSHIARQAGVRDIALNRLDGNVAELRLDFAGDSAQLERLLTLSGDLQRCAAQPAPEPVAPATPAQTDGLLPPPGCA